ncbi:hypothetical protein R3W88_014895 [Solanum pinnatisectum]|uniref:Pectinesterase catalytic domain-containing protein n=1 Tax=Solanum pinnatisectum TaxID=50273 RepID=A0AAV9KT02_9SOLN|nr:hypothetical protein R3W88_014895 [Solanum pinnatisectum]
MFLLLSIVVVGQGFVAVNITFQNTVGAINHQAVAIRNAGTIDFIFGNVATIFQNSNIYPKLPLQNQFNVITAQGRIDPNQNTGISIQNCTVKLADDLKFSNSSMQPYLGKPWKEYSRTIYAQSFIDGFVNPLGWREWSGHQGILHSIRVAESGAGEHSASARSQEQRAAASSSKLETTSQRAKIER